MTRYSHFDVLLASPTEPLRESQRKAHTLTMQAALIDMSQPQPLDSSWDICDDLVNLLQTLKAASPFTVKHFTDGVATSDEYSLDFLGGILTDAEEALRHCSRRQPLSEEGQLSFNTLLDTYTQLLSALPARVMLKCHRTTQLRIAAALNQGKKRGNHQR